ncbi:hypothetical protein Nepgr_001741 [Nepenthes gracilis]|uniref:Uncharacterized protein n=1 Tax=Nepenthes gracilis TaxID=150966 RepID=A0AAD3P919_NEPGR|nr:hypothetical protein Nepgr_001741 [Nepenthes gracilis]
MEDPAEDWRIQEYSPSEERNISKLRCIWNSGLRLGKKIAVAGILISSTPLVLPPLVAISTLGVAFSVPFGFIFASYACTEKLMNRLLSEPASPPHMLEYLTTINDEEEGKMDRVKLDDGNVEEDREQDYDIEAEEEEFEEDTRRGDEMMIELLDEGDKGFEEDGILPMNGYDLIDIDKDAKDLSENVEVCIKENGYEEDVGEDVEKEEQLPPNSVGEILKGIDEAEEEMSSMKEGSKEMPVDVVCAVVVAAEICGKNDTDVQLGENIAAVALGIGEEYGHKEEFGDREQKLERETKGLVEAIRDDGEAVDNRRKDQELSSQENEGLCANAEELKKPFGNQIVDDKEWLKKGSKGAERANEMGRHEKIKRVGKTEDKRFDNLSAIPKEEKPVESIGSGMEKIRDVKWSNSLNTEKQVEKTSLDGDIGHFIRVEQGPRVEKKLVVHVEKAADHTATNENGAVGQHSFSVGKRPKGMERFSGDIAVGNIDNHGLPISSEISILEPVEIAPEQATNASPKEIWEQIHAVRKIIGYKATLHTSCIEELKALYIFTGVEPPPTMVKETAVLEDIEEKIHFLKSIIGMK